MLWVSPTAIWAIAAGGSATGPPSPMFSPAAVRCTPAADSRAPRPGSPGHWWDRPQPPAITEVCRAALVSRPELIVKAGSPAWARAWLIRASTCWSAADCPAGDAAGAELAGTAGVGAAAGAGGAAGRGRLGCRRGRVLGDADGEPPRPGVALGDADDRAGDALAASGWGAALSAGSLARPGSRTKGNPPAPPAGGVMSPLTAIDEPRDPRGVIAPPLYSAAGLRAGRLYIRRPGYGRPPGASESCQRSAPP